MQVDPCRLSFRSKYWVLKSVSPEAPPSPTPDRSTRVTLSDSRLPLLPRRIASSSYTSDQRRLPLQTLHRDLNTTATPAPAPVLRRKLTAAPSNTRQRDRRHPRSPHPPGHRPVFPRHRPPMEGLSPAFFPDVCRGPILLSDPKAFRKLRGSSESSEVHEPQDL